jgi:hypothetical protein
MKSMNTNIPLTQSSFVDCGESIKEEIKEEESVDDPLSIHQEAENSNICEVIKEEVEEEESVDDSSFNQQELGNVGSDYFLFS